MVRFDDQRSRRARARASARRRDAHLATVDLPERGTDDGLPSLDPAGIGARHAGQPSADLSRDSRYAGGLSRRKRRVFDEVRVAQLQAHHDSVVRHPLTRQPRQVEGVARDEGGVSQRVTSHTEEVAGTFEHRPNLARHLEWVEHLECAPEQDRLRTSVDEEGGPRIALGDDRLGRIAGGGHPQRAAREAEHRGVDQGQPAGAQSQHADRAAPDDRARLAGQLHAPNFRGSVENPRREIGRMGAEDPSRASSTEPQVSRTWRIRSRACSRRRRTRKSRRLAIAAPSTEAGGWYAIRSSIRTPWGTSSKVKPPSCLISPDSETQPISRGRLQRFSRRTFCRGSPRARISTRKRAPAPWVLVPIGSQRLTPSSTSATCLWSAK